MSAVADSERNFHVTNWKYWNVVGRFSWIVVLMTHTSCKGDLQPRASKVSGRMTQGVTDDAASAAYSVSNMVLRNSGKSTGDHGR